MIAQAAPSYGFWDPNGSANLIITIVLFTWASTMVWRGALLGARGHAKPRLFVAVALTAGVVVNVAGLFDWISPEDRAAIARAITWVLAMSLGFTALTGVRYGRKVEAVVKDLDSLSPTDDDIGLTWTD